MTCIVGMVAEDGHVWMGGDRQATVLGFHVVKEARPKVQRIGPFLVGLSGSATMEPLIRKTLDGLPDWPDDDPEALVQQMQELGLRVHEACRNAHQLEDENEMSGNTLFGLHGHLFQMDSTGGIVVPRESWDAVGSGSWSARTALWTMAQVGLPDHPRDMVRLALLAAEAVTNHTGGPFDIISDHQE